MPAATSRAYSPLLYTDDNEKLRCPALITCYGPFQALFCVNALNCRV